MTKPPAYQYYPADFDTDTAAWNNREVGAYQRLLNYAWLNRGIPNDVARIATIVREDPVFFEQTLWPTISPKWISNGTDGVLINPRQEKEREKQKEYRDKQRAAGLRGVEAKKEKGSYPFDQATLAEEIKQPLKEEITEPCEENQGSVPEKTSSSSSSSSSSIKTKDKESAEPKRSVQHPPLPRIDFVFEQRDFIGITEADITSWGEAFPVVDIELEIKKAREWLLANPEKRKKKYRKFLTAWFTRTQDKGGTKGYNPKKLTTSTGKAQADKARDWDAAEAARKEADRRWRELDVYDRQPYLDKAQADDRAKLMNVETVAFLIFQEELKKDGSRGADTP